jgi:hypothetical protein
MATVEVLTGEESEVPGDPEHQTPESLLGLQVAALLLLSWLVTRLLHRAAAAASSWCAWCCAAVAIAPQHTA